MDNVARKWTICAFLLAAAVAATAAHKPPSLRAKVMSTNAYRTLSANITPYGPVPPNTYCHFAANASGGTPPYTYQWYVNNSPVGYGGTDAILYYMTGTSAFRIQVFVTDATSAQTNDSKIMSVYSGSSC